MADRDDMERLMLLENPDIDRVLECVFGVQPHEVKTFLTLMERPGSTVGELAAVLDRDRSNVNRSLSTLYEKSLIRRERRLLDQGGYVYHYYAQPMSDVKDRMHEGVEEWSQEVHDKINSFGEVSRSGGSSF